FFPSVPSLLQAVHAGSDLVTRMSWLTLASIPKLLFLLLPMLIVAAEFRAADLESKSAIELEEYRRHLSEELVRVAQKVESTQPEGSKLRLKRTLLSPLSASLPNRDSAYVQERIQELSAKENENSIDDEVMTPNEPEVKEPRIDEKLIALLNSLDDFAFDNVTVEGSGESDELLTSTLSPTLTTTEPSTTTASESSAVVDPTLADASTAAIEESGDNSTALLTSGGAESDVSTTTSSTTTMSSSTAPDGEEAPRRSPAHGVVISVSSPHSPSLSPMLANFSSMAAMETTPSPLTKTTTSESTPAARMDDPLLQVLPRRVAFNPTVNHTAEECHRLTQHELVRELKQKGTYNPDLMAWDVFGILRFLDRTIAEQYEMQLRNRTRGVEAAERNIEALSRILGELDVSCDVRSESVRERMQNMTMVEPRRSILSPRIRRRSKREAVLEELTRLMADLDEHKKTSTTTSRPSTTTSAPIYETVGNRQKLIGESHVVPFGCDRRGTEEDGYLRLCSACQSIRRLPDSFFPPFINEVTCDEDNACLYFYDYPHGRCKQKHMNFVVLRNIGTQECQVWRKFNLNVRVSCECFVDEMSFFAKYV
ncbi:hypothetical protein PMAYCL1PPCAC_31856, partial [Pristionchus mayeri]